MSVLALPFLFAPRTPSAGGVTPRSDTQSAERLQHDTWLAGLATGSVAAFDRIVEAFADPLQRFVTRIVNSAEAADVVQDVFAWLWEHRTTVPPGTNLRPYLYAAARNRALSLARHTQVASRSEAHFSVAATVPGMGEAIPAPDLSLEQLELARTVEQALDTLSPRVRQVALLRWQDGLRRQEIAEILGVSPATVKNQLATALRVLRPLVEQFRD